MAELKRDPARCEYRRTEPGDAAGVDAVCDLLRVILQRPPEACTVGEDACRACCRSFPPTPECPNPVVSSLVVGAAREELARDGVSADEQARLRAVWRTELDRLPTEGDLARFERALAAPPHSGGVRDIALRIPPPQTHTGPAVQTWAVAVTTAPRREPTLLRTVETLQSAGWSDPHLYVDGDVDLPESLLHLGITRRAPAVGAWPNYYLCMLEQLMRSPTFDALMIVQDDTCFYPHAGIKPYLEQILWPGAKPGLVSLFCSREYTGEQAGWISFQGKWLWGAQAFIFPRPLVLQFVTDSMVVRHRWERVLYGHANIDWLIGEWAFRNRIPVWYPTPSMVQHIGRVSAIWNGAQLSGNRIAARFLGDELA